jgi:hypothetical protein
MECENFVSRYGCSACYEIDNMRQAQGDKGRRMKPVLIYPSIPGHDRSGL